MTDIPTRLRTCFPFGNGHVHSLYPRYFRPYPKVDYVRERLELPDGDFLDLDRIRRGHKRLCILVHGLEGDTHRYYMTGMARAALEHGWDVLAMNMRSCSHEINRLPRFYHSGETGDLHQAVLHALAEEAYGCLALVGFSLGANQILKYLGEEPDRVPDKVSGAACFSAPCDLVGSAALLDGPGNGIYLRYFMKMLKAKISRKHEQFPDLIPIDGVDAIRTFREFDDRYTAPMHGFRDHMHYWTVNSSRQFLHRIQVPTLLVNAMNDSFLSDTCYPRDAADENPRFHLETPDTGGHVGFVPARGHHLYWSEHRAMEFLGTLE